MLVSKNICTIMPVSTSVSEFLNFSRYQHYKPPTGDPIHKLAVTSSTSYNYHSNYVSTRSHDSNFHTWYCILDRAVQGNYLKLFLSGTFHIGPVRVVSREEDYDGAIFYNRLVDTEVSVYSTRSKTETLVRSCGTIKSKGENFENMCDLFYVIAPCRFCLLIRPN